MSEKMIFCRVKSSLIGRSCLFEVGVEVMDVSALTNQEGSYYDGVYSTTFSYRPL